MPSKWIEIASPEVPASEVASDSLRLRVRYVQELLPLAAHEYLSDIEHIHHLRVACRRADATLKAFRPLLGNNAKPLQKWLRRIRQAAGPARDLDVLLARMKLNPDDNPNHADLVARLGKRRSKAQQALFHVETKSRTGKFDRCLDRCLTQLGKHKRKTSCSSFRVFAPQALRQASRPLLRLAGIQHNSLEALHELRIAGKRLRYSIEIFHGALPPNLRTELYPLIEKLQSHLGRMNDHATAQAIFQSLLVGMPVDSQAACLAKGIVKQHEAAELLRSDFLDWWTADRVATLESHLEMLELP